MTHIRSRWWLAAAAVLLAAAGAVWYWRGRRVLSTAELLLHLPPADAVVLHVDVASLRRAGLLDLIAGSRAAEESEYTAFVAQSGFNYREHLDGVIASFHGGQTNMLLTGRFDWKSLEAYTLRQRGVCDNGFCRLPASEPGRFISYFALRQGVMALSTGPDAWGATALRNPVRTRPAIRTAAKPIWLYIPGTAFKSADGLPSGTRLFAKALEDAEDALVSAGVQGTRFEAQIEATCKTEEAAVLLKAQLEKVTEVLKQLILRSGGKPNPHDLSGVLTQGSFRREDRRVIGSWPVERTFLESLAGRQ